MNTKEIKLRKLAVLLFVIFTFSTLYWAGLRVVRAYEFSINCEGYLKRAADSNTIELAIMELDTAIAYMEEKGLTEGIVSIFLKQPQNDIAFWYQNLVASRQELLSINPDAGQLEKSNILMKLRETLLDTGVVTYPEGISIYPNNLIYFIWGIASILGVCITGYYLYISTEPSSFSRINNYRDFG